MSKKSLRDKIRSNLALSGTKPGKLFKKYKSRTSRKFIQLSQGGLLDNVVVQPGSVLMYLGVEEIGHSSLAFAFLHKNKVIYLVFEPGSYHRTLFDNMLPFEPR